MGLSAAEKNRRKRERKKKEKEERRKRELEEQKQQEQQQQENVTDEEIEIEYVAEDLTKILKKTVTVATSGSSTPATIEARPDGLPPAPGTEGESGQTKDEIDAAKKERENNIEDVLRRFHQRAAVVPSGDDDDNNDNNKGDQSSIVSNDDSDYDSDDTDGKPKMSKRKLREMIRPSVAELKRRVHRPDLVEAHDVAAADPDFLIALKSIPHTTSVPFHWGRKRKYLQGKRGIDKVPYELPDFIVKTGITNVRDTAMEDEANQSIKQKNRGRINPKMGVMDVDYKVLYEAFFKYQTKPKGLTSWGDLYYEGKELENSTDIKPGGPFSKELRIALGMGINPDSTIPPPWLFNMQRYGPPPAHPKLRIPGLNAPLPNTKCQYGYHPGGWGKPPLDPYGRPVYGGNPLDPPGSGTGEADENGRELVTSDGKTVLKAAWGGLPTGGDYPGTTPEEEDDSDMDDSSSSSSSEEESDAMEESDGDEDNGGTESVLPPPPASGGIEDLRKQQPVGDETPAPRLYQVLETGASAAASQVGSIFQSDVRYVLPGAAAAVPEGAESVLSKAVGPPTDGPASRKKRKTNDDDDEDELDKNFKF